MFRIAVNITLIIGLAVSASASALESLVQHSGELSVSGKSKLKDARFKLLPVGWKLRATDMRLYDSEIAWPKGQRWVENLRIFGERNKITFVLDGSQKEVLATDSIGLLAPGVVLINSKVSEQARLYKLDMLRALADEVEESIRERDVMDELLFNKVDSVEQTAKTLESNDNNTDENGNKKQKNTEEKSNNSIEAEYALQAQDLKVTNDWIAQNYFDYLQFKSLDKLTDRLWYDNDNGYFVFQSKQGSLRKNIKALLDNTEGASLLDPKDILARHQVFNDMEVSGESVLHIVDQLVAPYQKPSQVKFVVHPNRIITFNYERDGGLR